MGLGKMIGAFVDIPSMVEDYIRKIGEGLAKENQTSIESVSLTIIYDKGKPFIAFYIKQQFVRYLTNEEIQKLCS